jgi:hypothetical protein
LKLVSHQENLILITLKRLADITAFEVRVHLGAGFLERIGAGFLVVNLAREGDKRLDRIAFVFDVLVDG